MKVKVDEDLCIGCGLCSTIAEKTFRLNKKGKAEVIKQGGDGDEKIKEAIECCPVSAISAN